MNKSKEFFLLVGLMLLSVTLSCGPSSQNESTSVVEHTLNQPVNSLDSLQWAVTSDSDYRNFVAPLTGGSPEALPASHELTKRVQFWIDTLWEKYSEKYPEIVKAVPKPKARIIESSEVNAFIAPAAVCYQFPMRISEASGFPYPERKEGAVYFDLTSGSLQSYPLTQYPCKKVAMTAKDAEKFATEFNSRDMKCKLKVAEDANLKKLALIAGSECSRGEDLNGATLGLSVAVIQTADWVNIYSAIFPIMKTEEAFVSVMVHELGHYMRSHITAPRDMYDFFYILNEENPDSRPKPDANLQHFGEEVYASAQERGVLVDFYKAVKDQKYNSALFMGMGSLAEKACVGGRCEGSCKSFYQLVNDKNFIKAMPMFPIRKLDGNGQAKYQEFETKFDACFADMPIKKSPTDRGISVDDVAMAVVQPSWVPLSYFNPDIVQSVMRQNQALANIIINLGDSVAKGTVGETIKVLSDVFTERARKSGANLDKAHEMHLGQYTSEQEADELSMEWMEMLKLNPKEAINTYRYIGEYVAALNVQPFYNAIPVDKCLKLYENGWRDESGNYVFAPVGDYAEVHHSDCYRMFNLDRELRAHRYETAPAGSRPQAHGVSWDQIIKIAQQISDKDNPSNGRGPNFSLLPEALKGSLGTYLNHCSLVQDRNQ